MRVLIACAAGAFLALSLPIVSASAAMPGPGSVAARSERPGLIQADWDGRPDWHHHWRHEWHDHYRPEWRPDWHHHWHHRWDRPYGYQY